jgi:hypothetical protein
MEELRRVGRSDCQPLFCGRSDRLGSRLDRQPLFRGRSDRLGSRSDRQPLFRGRLDRQQRKARWNAGRRQWCGHRSRFGRVILQ